MAPALSYQRTSDGALAAGDSARWNTQLPPDLKRAAPELYRSLRAQWAASVRDWLSLNFVGSKLSAQWTDLWTAAVAVDYRLARETSDHARLCSGNG